MTIVPDEDLLLGRDLCFIDVETTGLIYGFHEVIELGAIRVSADARIEKCEFNAKLRPCHPERLSPKAQEVNGYTDEGWRGAETNHAEVWNRFSAFAAGCVPVCHNPSFDRPFVTIGCRDYAINDIGLHYHWLGTESLAWPLVRRGLISKLTLKNLCEYLGVPPEPEPHSGLEGARACLGVYRRLVEILAPINIGPVVVADVIVPRL